MSDPDPKNKEEAIILRKAEEALNCENPSDAIRLVISSLEETVRKDKELSDTQRARLKILVNSELPLNSIIALDPNPKEKRGRMQVELYRHGGKEPKLRFNLLLSRKDDPELYEYYWQSLSTLLEKSHPP